MNYKDEFEIWARRINDQELKDELALMDEGAKEDAFYRNLVFGTGGLRGIIGAGTNRMNIYTVAKATQGLANYLINNFDNPSVAISFDSRIKSETFALLTASVFAFNGIHVWIYPVLMPTPCLSYAVRTLRCSAGVMITASHNPSKYNGYKVYGNDGCQITNEAAKAIFEEIEKIDLFDDVKGLSLFENFSSYEELCLAQESVKNIALHDLICNIPDSVYDDFIDEVKKQSVLYGDEIERNVAIVYTPLNGTGLKPVTRALNENGFTNVIIVKEQEQPDGNFPTCSYPNPEIPEAMELGLKYCRDRGADLLISTDPDADRCGIAVKNNDDFELLSGNEVGLLLFDFICSQRIRHNKMPKHPVLVKTIVTSDLAEKIADYYGVKTVNVLTGFKFIGEVIGKLEIEGRESDFICGFEESYGYLTGTYVRDKDAVDAAFMLCEMFAYYKTRGISLTEKLERIYKEFGYCLNTLHSYEFEGPKGLQKMSEMMAYVRKDIKMIGNEPVTDIIDYLNGVDGLPKSDVVRLKSKSSSIVIRPSGTEPKIKVYISIVTDDKGLAIEKEKEIFFCFSKDILMGS